MTLVRPKIRSNMAAKSAFIFIYTIIVIILFCWVDLNYYLKHALVYNLLRIYPIRPRLRLQVFTSMFSL